MTTQLNTGGSSCGAKSGSASEGLHVWKQWYGIRLVVTINVCRGCALNTRKAHTTAWVGHLFHTRFLFHWYRTLHSPNVHTTYIYTRRYDKAKVSVPHFVPGTDVEFNITLTIDHGGQVGAHA